MAGPARVLINGKVVWQGGAFNGKETYDSGIIAFSLEKRSRNVSG